MASQVATPPIHNSIFEQALKDFQDSLSDQEKSSFQSTKFHDVKTFLAALQTKQKSARTLQNMGRLSRFLEAMQAYEKVMDVFVNVHGGVASVWGPMKFLLETTRTHSEAFNGVLDAYKRIGESLPLLEQFQRLFGTHEHMKNILAELFRDIFEFHKRALHFFRRPNWKLVFAALWKDFKTRFGDILEDILEKKCLVETQASLVEYESAARDRLQADQHVQDTNRHEQARRRLFIVEWLALPRPYHTDHDRVRSVRESSAGSGRWLLKKARFRSWYTKTGNVPILWVTGRPGAGKSVLASLVIDEVLCLGSSAILLYFYCRQDDFEKNTFLAIARSMLRQLLARDESLSTILYDAAYASLEPTLNTIKLAEELLSKCLKGAGLTYVVVDGLDECPETEQQRITKFLLQFAKDSGADSEQSRCVFFSQNDQNTRKLLSKLPTITIEEPDCRADVTEYCQRQAHDLKGRFRLDDTEATNLGTRVAFRCEGIFLLAKITMANLSLQTTAFALKEELQSDRLPRDLNEAYDRVMQKLWRLAPTQYERDIKRLLTFLACAFRPVKWREVQCAFAIEDWRNSDYAGLNIDDQIVNAEQHQLVVDPKNLCGALIEVEDTPNGSVGFVHPTFKKYLFASGTVKPSVAHASLAELCLSYLSLWPFNAQVTDEQIESNARKGAYIFTEYAFAGWVKHLELALRSPADLQTDSHPAIAAEFLPSLAETLGSFLEQHWTTPAKPVKLQKKYHGLLDAFENGELRTKVEQTLASMQRLETSFESNTEPYETLDLFKTVARARLLLERLTHDLTLAPLLHDMYGLSVFKCSRIGCKWFHEGLTTMEERELHRKKHERAFKCTHSGCPYIKLGFVTEADLVKHEQEFEQLGPSENDFLSEHDSDDDRRSPMESSHDTQSVDAEPATHSTDDVSHGSQEPAAPVKSLQAQRHPATFQCHLCPTEFTRRYDLWSHLRTHTVGKPFVCDICEKGFIRAGNHRRHQRRHCRFKKFVCKGTLKSGAQWGCGWRFARADALTDHFCSDIGRRCIRPQLEEDAVDRDRMEAQKAAELSTVQDNGLLPESVLQ